MVLVALLAALALVWILGTVASGGPDEPVHLVRGAALVRGELNGRPFDGVGEQFDLPAWIGFPDHSCFSLQELQPASCATAAPRPTGDAVLTTTSGNYPIWGHIPPGLATFFPAAIGNQLARVFDATIPVGLIAMALLLAVRRGALATAGTALAVTPMAWFSVIVVNPSGLAIAGGLALWVGLLSMGPERAVGPLVTGTDGHVGPRVPGTDGHVGPWVPGTDRLAAWAVAAGWAAAVLPRRDGMIWAGCTLAACVLVGFVDLASLTRRLGRGPLALIAASTLATWVWAATSDTFSSKLLVLIPVLPLGAWAARRVWFGPVGRAAPQRIALVAGVTVVALVGAFLTMSRRPGGFDGTLLERIIGQSGLNLEEAVGLLGWLDIPLPLTALALWVVALGMIGGIALLHGRSDAVYVAFGVVGVAAVVSWALEMNQGDTTGTYWQGRYYLPFVIGVPVVVAWVADIGRVVEERRVARFVVGAALVVMTAAFAASLRRWGVGTAGSLLPWRWDTYGTLVPPLVLLVVHVAIAAALWWCADSTMGRAVDVVHADPDTAEVTHG